MPEFLAIIPARYSSTRFPGKPLADIGGKSMIQRVYERVASLLDHVIVATDDERIRDAVGKFGGVVIMTSPDHKSGTDRCAEALEKFEEKKKTSAEVVINIQGDEPFIRLDHISLLQSCFKDGKTEIATLIRPVDDESVIHDPNRPKVVIGKNGFAIYFSRSAIPYIRNGKRGEWHSHHTYYHHIGMYAYRARILREITQLPPGRLELAESLEQLRWIENGYKIKTAITEYDSVSIDTPEDLKKALQSGLL
jgi:3-deoxy-manno-octulosonate cytidylyltransferase (CMP-KDO synthetase)